MRFGRVFRASRRTAERNLESPGQTLQCSPCIINRDRTQCVRLFVVVVNELLWYRPRRTPLEKRRDSKSLSSLPDVKRTGGVGLTTLINAQMEMARKTNGSVRASINNKFNNNASARGVTRLFSRKAHLIKPYLPTRRSPCTDNIYAIFRRNTTESPESSRNAR